MAKECSKIAVFAAMIMTACFVAGCRELPVRAPEEPAAKPLVAPGASLINATRHTSFDVGETVEPCVSRDGTMLLFASNHHGPTFDVFAKKIGGKTSAQLSTNPADDRQPALSPNGRMLAFVSNRGGNWDIYIRSMKPGSKEIQVTSDKADDIHPSWSPDGTRLVYSSYNRRKKGWELKIIRFSAEGYSLHSLNVDGLLPEWCPREGSETILFQRPRGRFPEMFTLWTVRSDGQRLVEVLETAQWATVSPTWSADGAWIAFSSANAPESCVPNGGNLWIIRADGKYLTRIGRGGAQQWDAACAPDKRIFFTTPRDGVKNIWSIAPELEKVFPESGPQETKPAARPDETEAGAGGKQT